MLERYRGEIAGFGTTSGHRIVIGRWEESPFGSFADVMVESPSGHRTLLAPSAEVAEFVATTYRFDETSVVPVIADRSLDGLDVAAGELRVRLGVGPRTWLGRLLRLVPRGVAESRAWCTVLDPAERVILRGVRTRGSAGNGRTEFYGATDQRSVASVEASWAGEDLGPLADVWPPVRFGFSSTPRRPSVVATTTTITSR